MTDRSSGNGIRDTRAGTETESGNNASGAFRPVQGLDPRSVDLFEFARSGREAVGAVSVAQLPRMLAEVPADLPADLPGPGGQFAWHAQGTTAAELQDDGSEGRQAYLRLAVHGSAWLTCQRCLAPYEQAFDVETLFRIAATEEEADELDANLSDDDEVDVIVGSRQFDLVDLIEEELLLALPLVPKHDVCPAVHESLASGADGALGIDSVDDLPDEGGADAGEPGEGKPNPFAALQALKKDGGSDGTH